MKLRPYQERAIPLDAQHTGAVAAYVIDGRVVKNGPGAIASKELVI